MQTTGNSDTVLVRKQSRRSMQRNQFCYQFHLAAASNLNQPLDNREMLIFP